MPRSPRRPARPDYEWSCFSSSGFFHVDLVNLTGVNVFFAIDERDRIVHILGVTPHPTGEWTEQAARQFTWHLGDRVADLRYLIRDRAGQFTAAFDAVFAAEGVEVLRSRARSARG